MHGHCESDLAFIPKEMEKEGQEQVCGSASPESGEERIWTILERTTWFGQLAIGGKKLQFSPVYCWLSQAGSLCQHLREAAA